MTKEEYFKLVVILKANYQRFPNYTKSLEDSTVHKAQFTMLKDLSFNQLSVAVMSWCQKEKYPPSVADLRGELFDNSNADVSDDEAWGLFWKAVKDYNFHNAEELYRKLGEKDKALEQVARNLNIKEVATSPSDNPMADRAHFLKMYAVAKKRIKSNGMLSESVRKAIGENILKSIDGPGSDVNLIEG